MIGLMLLGGCTTDPIVTGAIQPQPQLVAPYQLDSGDQLRIIVFGQADLSNTYGIDTRPS